MPLPLIVGIGAAIAAAAGAGAGIQGAAKMKKANDMQKEAQDRHSQNEVRLKRDNEKASEEMDNLGELELSILKSFKTFSDLLEQIHNRPEFKNPTYSQFELPQYNREELEQISIGADVLLGGLGGAALGTAGGFAAAGATTAAVMALGTASTGTAIASLSGIAATNATLAALGGGAIAAGGGGIALGTTVLGAATLGVGLLVGGIIFNLTGSSMTDKANRIWSEMETAEKEINRICRYLNELYTAAGEYIALLRRVRGEYDLHLSDMQRIIEQDGRTDWNDYTASEKLMVENTVLLVGLLYNMCKIQFVLQSQNANALNIVNHEDIQQNLSKATRVLGYIQDKENWSFLELDD